jgi:hypothetical protein
MTTTPITMMSSEMWKITCSTQKATHATKGMVAEVAVVAVVVVLVSVLVLVLVVQHQRYSSPPLSSQPE